MHIWIVLQEFLHLHLCTEDNDCDLPNSTHCDQTRCDNSKKKKNMSIHNNFQIIHSTLFVLIKVSLKFHEANKSSVLACKNQVKKSFQYQLELDYAKQNRECLIY